MFLFHRYQNFLKDRHCKKIKLKKKKPTKLYFFFFVIIYHSYDAIPKQLIKKKIKKNEPLIIKKKLIGISMKVLIILFCNSFFIKYFQNFF